MRPVGPRAELRVELARDEPRVVGELDDLDQPSIRRDAAEGHPGVAKHLSILVVELEAMAVPFVHDLLAVGLVRQRAGHELAWVQAEAHGAAHLVDVPLLGHEVDHRCRREGCELRRVGVRRVKGLAGEVDHCALHTEAQAEVRDPVVTRVAGGHHLSLDAAVSEPARHHDPGDTHQR